MAPLTLLSLNVALGFYNMGTIWAHEVDIFRTWQMVEPESFLRIQTTHWRKLPYWVFAPLGLWFACSIALLWFHPAGSPRWTMWGDWDAKSHPTS